MSREDDITGAAGLLAVSGGHVLLGSSGGDGWGLVELDEGFDAVAAARRAVAALGVDPDLLVPHDVVRGAVVGGIEGLPPTGPAAEWVPVDGVAGRALLDPFGATWPLLRGRLARPALVVDCANVMGSRPDGWWRDRRGAAARLRDSLAPLAAGVPRFAGFDLAFPEVVLVVEGKARGIDPVDGVVVLSAPGEGDDAIAEAAADRAERGPCTVVTADRELRGRCAAVGADVVGPRWLLDRVG